MFISMDLMVKAIKAIRTNWKKSTAATVGVGYGTAKMKEEYDKEVLLRGACEEVSNLSEHVSNDNAPSVTVILDPVANNKKAKDEYHKYCEPLLHLSGLHVNLIQTTSKRSAKDIVAKLRDTDVIVVAGGDGMLSETVTGLLRRNGNSNEIPIGILPLGHSNSVGNSLFPGGRGVKRIKQLIGASMAIIKGNTVLKDVLKIEPTTTDDEPIKPIYAMSSIEWGAFRDALASKDKFSLCGSLSEYLALIFSESFKKGTGACNCDGLLKYTQPCEGCMNCIQKNIWKPPKTSLLWRWMMQNPSTIKAAPQNDIVQVVNPACGQPYEIDLKTCDVCIKSPNIEKNGPIPALKLILGKDCYSYMEFLSEGWNRLQGVQNNNDIITARTVELFPKDKVTIGIDEAALEVKRVKVTLMPKLVKLFCT